MEAWTLPLAILLVTGAGLAPAGLVLDSLTTGEVSPAAEAAETHHVHIVDFDMDPDPLEIEVGDTVAWHNHDDVTHTATDDDDAWDTGSIGSGETVELTFDQAADYTYHCEVHPDSMTGFELSVVDTGPKPTVEITAPSEGATVQGDVEVTGTASPAESTIDRVEVRVDGGPWQEATGTTSWSWTWDSTTVSDGEHTIEARSLEGGTASELATVNVTTDNPLPDLQVEEIESTWSPTTTEIEATIVNDGTGDAPATSVRFTYAGADTQGFIGTADVPALGIGETATVSVSWDTTGKVGAYDVSATVDPDEAVPEDEDANNAAEAQVCMPPAEGVTCAIPGRDLTNPSVSDPPDARA